MFLLEILWLEGCVTELIQFHMVGIYNSLIEQPNISVSVDRTPTQFEIELPIENGGISYVNGHEAPITNDTVICVKPGCKRHTKLPFKCYYVHMSVTDGRLHDTLCSLPDFIKTEKSDYYLGLFERMRYHFNAGAPQDEIRLQSIVLEMIYRLCQESSLLNVGSPEKTTSGIYQSLQYIKKNLSGDLSLKTLAAHASLSPVHFHHCFKTALGKTPHKYVEEERLHKAISLLMTTDRTLADIAYSCGFSSQSYFSYAFKQKTGTTPRKYVQKINSHYTI